MEGDKQLQHILDGNECQLQVCQEGRLNWSRLGYGQIKFCKPAVRFVQNISELKYKISGFD